MAHQLPYNLTFLLFLYFFFIIYDSRLLTFSIFTVYFLIKKNILLFVVIKLLQISVCLLIVLPILSLLPEMHFFIHLWVKGGARIKLCRADRYLLLRRHFWQGDNGHCFHHNSIDQVDPALRKKSNFTGMRVCVSPNVG